MNKRVKSIANRKVMGFYLSEEARENIKKLWKYDIQVPRLLEELIAKEVKKRKLK